MSPKIWIEIKYLQEIREGKVQHVVHPCKLKSNIRTDQVITNEKARSKAFFLPLHCTIGYVYESEYNAN